MLPREHPEQLAIGNFTVSAPERGTMIVTNILGQEVSRYSIAKGNNSVKLPEVISTGIYTAKITTEQGVVVSVAKLMYQK